MRKIGGYILASYGPTMMTSEDHERVKAPRAQWKSTFWAADTAEVLRPFWQKVIVEKTSPPLMNTTRHSDCK